MTEHTDTEGKKSYQLEEEELENLVLRLAAKIQVLPPKTGFDKFWSGFQKVIVGVLTACVLGLGSFIFASSKTSALHEQRICVLENLVKDIGVKVESLPSINTKLDFLVKGQLKNQ